MTMSTEYFREQLKQKGLKVTPQRIAIYEAVVNLKNHPTAENIIDSIKKNHPSISVGTVYKILDSLVENRLLKKVKNEKDVMRYDAMIHKHHHLYCSDTDKIEDFDDPELDKIIADYFSKKKIKGFKVKDISLQITGEFKNN
ncbi:MAG TPA: Fur family transcriptional regulator [Ignavibacteria bacterium]|nr:Fur family transcriptional regulator [Ignavibacteria bacterium]